MTPKEKARQLYEEYRFKFFGNLSQKTLAKQCALIAVDELLEECRLERDWYWEQVKEEINKL